MLAALKYEDEELSGKAMLRLRRTTEADGISNAEARWLRGGFLCSM
jgi:hypothetical protein